MLAKLADFPQGFITGTAMSHEPAADRGGGSAMATPTMNIDRVAILNCAIDRVQDVDHEIGRGDVIVGNRKCLETDVDSSGICQIHELRPIGHERHSTDAGFVRLLQIDDAVDACIKQCTELPIRLVGILTAGITPSQHHRRLNPP